MPSRARTSSLRTAIASATSSLTASRNLALKRFCASGWSTSPVALAANTSGCRHASTSVEASGITLDSGHGAKITLVGNTVDVNDGALKVT